MKCFATVLCIAVQDSFARHSGQNGDLWQSCINTAVLTRVQNELTGAS